MRKVPKLRFKEFSDEWEEKKLEEVCNDFIVPMRDKPKNLIGEIPWCRIEDFEGKYLYESKSNQGVSKETINEMNLKIFPIDTLLVSCSAYLGRCAIVKKELITNQTFIGIVPNKVKLNIEYFYYLMSLQEKKLNLLSSGTTISYLSKEQFKKFNLNISKILQEQEKIANFLSSIDKKISLTKEKLELFRDYKKGVMQKIFSQELRFKDSNGNDYPKWEEKKLSEISNLITKGTTPKKFEENGNVKFIKIEAISSNKINNKKCLFISEKTHITELQRSILEKNDLLFSIAGSLGKTAIIVEENLPANTNQALCIIRLNENQNHKFILYLLNSKTMIDYIFLNTSIGAQPNLSLEQMKNFKFNLPTLEEQQKIADFLSSIDSKIENIEKELERLKEFKRGLLQQMFV